MAIQYFLDTLEPIAFQRLINALLTARFGERLRVLPLRGSDGGRDAETPSLEKDLIVFDVTTPKRPGFFSQSNPGRYFFQAKYHRTVDRTGGAVRAAVVSDFEKELRNNVLGRLAEDSPSFFYLVTNVPGSKDSVAKVDEKRRELLIDRTDIQADVLWQEHVTAWLDQTPGVWSTFPEIFPGMIVPQLGRIAATLSEGLPRSLKLAIRTQSNRDGIVRFRQINLEQRLSKLFVDLDVRASLRRMVFDENVIAAESSSVGLESQRFFYVGHTNKRPNTSCIRVLTSERPGTPQKIILEGGPGQGKSTVTQMLVELYRALLLQTQNEYPGISTSGFKARFPFRVELRLFAEWLGDTDRSVEEFLAETFRRDAGGAEITVHDIHSVVEKQPVLLIFDGVDEVGSDDLRDAVIAKAIDCADRFSSGLNADLRVIITSRPPAIAGRMNKLAGFSKIQILPLNSEKTDLFVQRWTEAQCTEASERERVRDSFDKRKAEQHVRALVSNPMQLSVLLHFIRLKGEAFPDRRAELYREYFKTVIDRDVEKSPQLRQNRDEIEALHEVIGFEIHSRAEADAAAGTLTHDELIVIVQDWLTKQGIRVDLAPELFRIGEERLGLIVALKGEGADTRYGFEVQPVREYFAAAFINDKYEANAHDIFQAMARRSFWREVALFLAGLRRANEKADLLSRARALDDSVEDGWRGDGKAIVLQLLQEGILTAPGHVHQEALSFLMQALDPADHRPQNLPPELNKTLPTLFGFGDNEQNWSQLAALLDASVTCVDRQALASLWYVANRTLPTETIWRHAKKYEVADERISGLVQLLWPAEAGLKPGQLLAKEVTNNDGDSIIPDWAEYLYRATFLDDSLTGHSLTKDLHERLFEEFAFQVFPQINSGRSKPLLLTKRFAIWNLALNLQLLLQWIAGPPPECAMSDGPADYSGLSNEIGSVAASLVEVSTGAIDHLRHGRSFGRGLSNFFDLLSDLIDSDGLPSWIACRFAVTLMAQIELSYMRVVGGQTYWVESRVKSNIGRLESWRSLRRRLTPLFRSALPEDLDAAGRTLAAKILQLRLHATTPSHVRINGTLQSVPALLMDSAKKGNAVVPSWVTRVPVPKYWIGDLLESDSISSVLRLLAHRRVGWNGPKGRLGLLAMKRVLSEVRRLDDPEVSSGALYALSGSNFWNVAVEATLGKMLEADKSFLDIGYKIFGSRDTTRAERVPELKKLIAELIVQQKIDAGHSTGNAAARFLAENRLSKFSPLRLLGVFPAGM